MNDLKRHNYGILEALTAAQMSKDPSTKVGACILRPDGTIASKGWNGFPRGVKDDVARLNNRELKYLYTVHADLNAILNAREPLRGYSMYLTPMPPCACCAGAIIQSGISSVFWTGSCIIPERWKASFEAAYLMFNEAGVNLTWMKAPLLPYSVT